jgi:hypothetical protein
MKFNFESYWDNEDPRKEAVNHPVLFLEHFQVGHGKYGQISLRPAYIYNRSSDGIETFDFYSDHRGEHILCWFSLWAQFDWLDKDENRDAYSVRLGYNDEKTFTIESMEWLDEKVSFLRKISRGLLKIEDARGQYKDFAEYAQRLGEVMGVKYFAVRTNDCYPKEFRLIAPRDIARIIRHVLKDNGLTY